MGLDNYDYDDVEQHIKDIKEGRVVLIPNPLERLDEAYNLLPSRYTLISGATGSGKTSFMDFNYILAPYVYMRENGVDDVHYEVLYFSLERKTLFKKFKWISWLLYVYENKLYSTEFLLGYTKEKPTEDILDLVNKYKNTVLNDLLEHVTIRDGKTKAKQIVEAIEAKAWSLGTFFESDADHVYINKNPIPAYTFDKTKLRATKHKGNEVFIEIDYQGVKFTLKQHDHRYIPNTPKTLFYVVLDGINLIGDKEAIDEVSEILANARDLYGFSIVVVTQQNRAQASTDRLKLHGSSMGPQMEDIYKSSQMAFDSDLVLGLFDPFYFKAYDNKGMVGGYQIVSGGTMSPQGFSRFRSLHILKNSFGFAGKRYGLKFLGEVGDFKTLPLPDKEPLKLERVYNQIANGR